MAFEIGVWWSISSASASDSLGGPLLVRLALAPASPRLERRGPAPLGLLRAQGRKLTIRGPTASSSSSCLLLRATNRSRAGCGGVRGQARRIHALQPPNVRIQPSPLRVRAGLQRRTSLYALWVSHLRSSRLTWGGARE